MTILGEILRGENFENEKIILVYELLIGEEKTWELDQEDDMNEKELEDFNVTKSVTQMAISTQAIMNNG